MPKHMIQIQFEVEVEVGTLPTMADIVGKLRGLILFRPGLLGRGTRIDRDSIRVREVKAGE
jgi:hypothetical protein